tara:strand:- start:22 stop:1587 length:1566 start_codon:yes stop_codon:yes gene_type:complete
MSKDKDKETFEIDFSPEMATLSYFAHIPYTAMSAIAEFVDNSLSSYLKNEKRLHNIHPPSWKLRIGIYITKSKIQIIDNAAGIDRKDCARAFKAGAAPDEKDKGLSEFGMGMKTAALWFSKSFVVQSSALGEKVERTVKFDLDKVLDDGITKHKPEVESAGANQHGTTVTLNKLRRIHTGLTKKKIKEYISSMYRHYIKKNRIEIRVDEEKLEYEMPPVLNAPFFHEVGVAKSNKKIRWHKNFSFSYGKSKIAKGFAGIFDEGNIGFAKTKYAGFNLFRYDRLIQGVGENKGYRPSDIFGNPQSHSYQRIFGEIHLNNQPVSHIKDGFIWDDVDEKELIEKLKKSLQKGEVNIFDQAKNYRLDRRSRDLKIQTVEGLDGAIKLAPTALKILEEGKIPRQVVPTKEIPKPKNKEVRRKTMKYEGYTWNFEIILNYDKNERDWIQVFEKGNRTKDITIIIAMGMGFTQQYFGSKPEEVEGMLALVEYIALAEIVEKSRGTSKAHAIRMSLNEIIRRQPPDLGY